MPGLQRSNDKDDEPTLSVLLLNIQQQLNNTASKQAVDGLSNRIDILFQTVNNRIDKLSADMHQLTIQSELKASTNLRRIVTVQTTIIVTMLGSLIGLAVNFILKSLGK